MSDPARLAATVYVSNLAPFITPGHLHAAFIPFGDIADINLPKPDLPPGTAPPPPGTVVQGHRGFGYIEFESAEDAKEAIDNMDKSELFGKVIRVAKAKPMTAVGEGLGSKIALWEQEGYLAAQGEKEIKDQEGGEQTVEPGDPMTGLEELDMAGPRES